MNIEKMIVEYKKLENEIYKRVYAVNDLMGKVLPDNRLYGEGCVHAFENDLVIMIVEDYTNGNDYYFIPISYLYYDPIIDLHRELLTKIIIEDEIDLHRELLTKIIIEDENKRIEALKRKEETREKARKEKQIEEEKALYESLRKKFENS